MHPETHLLLHQLRVAEATRHPQRRPPRRARPPGAWRRPVARQLVRLARRVHREAAVTAVQRSA